MRSAYHRKCRNDLIYVGEKVSANGKRVGREEKTNKTQKADKSKRSLAGKRNEWRVEGKWEYNCGNEETFDMNVTMKYNIFS